MTAVVYRRSVSARRRDGHTAVDHGGMSSTTRHGTETLDGMSLRYAVGEWDRIYFLLQPLLLSIRAQVLQRLSGIARPGIDDARTLNRMIRFQLRQRSGSVTTQIQILEQTLRELGIRSIASR